MSSFLKTLADQAAKDMCKSSDLDPLLWPRKTYSRQPDTRVRSRYLVMITETTSIQGIVKS